MQNVWLKIILGIALWALVYFASIPMLPIIKTDAFYFKTLIGFVFTLLTVLCSVIFFARVRTGFLREGLSAGIIWMLISLIIDYPIFVMKHGMTFGNYFRDIGLTYLAIPAITIAAGFLLERKAALPEEKS